MAGRGTDIILGKELRHKSSGLHVIGTERHTARRIDDQLIGRSGRQGDPGSSRFYLSLQDELFRLFADDDMPQLVKAIENGQTRKLKMLTRKAQRKSEETSYAMRKHLIDYDDVINKQRKAIYKMRMEILANDEVGKHIRSLILEYIDDLIKKYVDPSLDYGLRWNDMKDFCVNNFGLYIPDVYIDDVEPESKMREYSLSKDFFGKLVKAVMLEVLDTAWIDYLSYQSEFDNSILLRSYIKENILVDYKRESAKLFKDMLSSVRYETLKGIFNYPLPDEKINSGRQIDKRLSDQVKKLL